MHAYTQTQPYAITQLLAAPFPRVLFFASRVYLHSKDATPRLSSQILHLLLCFPFYSASNSPSPSFPLPSFLLLCTAVASSSSTYTAPFPPATPPRAHLRLRCFGNLISRICCFPFSRGRSASFRPRRELLRALSACLPLFASFGLSIKRFCVFSRASSSASSSSYSYCSLYSLLRFLLLLLLSSPLLFPPTPPPPPLLLHFFILLHRPLLLLSPRAP